MHHTAVLTGLTPGAKYTYTYGDDGAMSAAYTFTQPSLRYPFGVSIFGDMGQDIEAVETYNFPPAPNTTCVLLRWTRIYL